MFDYLFSIKEIENYILKEGMGFINPELTYERVHQLESEIIYDLNIERRYGNHFKSGTREIIENWWDRCLEVSQTNQVLINQLQYKGSRLYIAMSSPSVVVGFISRFQTNFLGINYGTGIDPKCLRMGSTSKEKNSNAAGIFGEGFKVEVNRLLASGCEVIYRSGNTEWNFIHDIDVFKMKSIKQATEVPNLCVAVSNIAEDTIFSLNENHYLFLQILDHDFIFKTDTSENRVFSGCELLCSPNHISKIYVHGIFVKEDTRNYPTFGINYKGSKGSFKALGISRDRDNILGQYLAKEIPYIWTQNKSHKQEAALVSLIYDTIDKYPNSALADEYRYSFKISAIHLGFFERLLAEFFRRHPKLYIPVKDSKQNEEILFLNFEPIKVSENMLNVLNQSRDCPTLEKAYEIRDEHFVNHPCVTFNADELKLTLEIGVELTSLFSPEVSDNLIKWKNIREAFGNSQRLLYYSKNHNQWIIDTGLLDINRVHGILMYEDSKFSCAGTNCVCVKQLVVNAFLDELVKRTGSPRSKYQNRIVRYYMELTSKGITTEASERKGERYRSASQLSEATKYQEASPPLHSDSKSRDSDNSLHKKVIDIMNDYVPIDKNENLRHVTKTTNISIQSALADCQKSSNANQEPHIRIPKKELTNEGKLNLFKSALDEWNCSNSEVNMEVKIVLGLKLYMPYPAGKEEIDKKMRLLVLLNSAIIKIIFIEVFKITNPSYYLFYDEKSDKIAFNMNNQLWFNLSTQFDQQNNLDIYIRQWFLVICHEHAHYFELGHKNPFIDAMAVFVLSLSNEWHSFIATYNRESLIWKDIKTNYDLFLKSNLK
eukprot:NODE_976_length_2812_cov_0.620715.p1 type:complete len:828 gc:universal NODE_976_length_2812_cov_0.620715:2639-156(-)